MVKKAYLGRFGPELEAALCDAVSAARREEPYGPLTVLVGSNLLGAYLRRRLAEALGGLFNVRFVTFADVAAGIAGSRSLAARPALPRRADLVIIEELAASGAVPPRFREAAQTKGFVEALAATFTDLAEGGCTEEIARSVAARAVTSADLGDGARGVLTLFADFRETVERLGGDVHSRFRRAISERSPLALGSRVIAYGFYDFNELQWRLLGRISEESDLHLFMPWDEKETYRFASKTKGRLERTGFETAVVSEAGGASKDAGRPRLLDLPGEEEEVREIARSILALAGEKDVRFGEVAIIVPSMETYGSLLREVLDEARIPCFIEAGPSSGADLHARGALRLLGLLGPTMERSDLVEFLVSAPMGEAPAGADQADRVSRWVRRSAEAGIIGERGWLEESGALVERLRSEAETGDGSEEDLAAALHVDGVIRRIAATRDAIGSVSTWSGAAEVLSSAVRELFRPGDDTERVREAIDDLAGFDGIGIRPSLESLSRILESELRSLAPSAGRFGGEGVNVLSLAQARGLAFRAVFIPGLAERIFPTAVRQDPLLSDAERLALARLTGGVVSLSEKRERLKEEALLFEIALQSGLEDVVLSFPRFEEGTGKERIPSSFLRFVEGSPPGGTRGDALHGERVSRGAWAKGDKPLLSEDELDLARALQYAGGSGFLPDSVFFSRGARLVKRRWGTRTFTEYDGVFSSKAAVAGLRASLDERGWRFAPTALEAYAACPFAYFLSSVLGVEVLEEPERIVMLSPRDRGDCIHKLLARLFAELKREGLLPVRAFPAERVSATAERVVSRFLEEFPRTRPVGLPVFWDMEKRLVRDAVLRLLEDERSDEEGFVPVHFEESFGRERDDADVSCDCGERTVRFYGRIDRIDLGGGGSFRVIDYKTGKLPGADRGFAGGTALQLPVYLMAASRILQLPLERGTAMYRHVGPRGGAKPVLFSGSQWEASEGEFVGIVDLIVSGIEKGVFFAFPDARRCETCEVSSSCPAGVPGMPHLYALKAEHDERSRAYREMGEGSEVPE